MTHAPETGARKLALDSGTSFSHQMQLEVNFLVPETKMADDDDADAIAAVCLIAVAREDRKRKRTVWVQPWLSSRSTHGAYYALLQELDTRSFKNFLRMDRDSFELLHEKVSPTIQRQDTAMRLSISPEERLAMTLRYLATGE